jgi:hypothetical protein
MSTKEHEQWFKDNIPTAVQLAVEGNFGKPNINQSFFSAVTLRHVVPLLSKSGFVSRKTGKNMEKAFYPWLLYNRLRMEYQDIDFRPLRDPNPTWEQETGTNAIRAKMMTACFIYYDFDTPTVVRFIGGPHVGAHRDTTAILTELQGKVTEKAWNDLKWLYTCGAPHHCNAEAMEDNFMAYFLYGNHKSA